MSKQERIEEFGRSKPADEFFKAFTKAADSRFLSNRELKTVYLIKGATEAFYQGRPENFQALMQNFRNIKFREYGSDYPIAFAARKLDRLLDESTDKQTDIELALAKTSPADKQAILNQTLEEIVWRSYYNNDDTILALLACGADPNAKTTAKPGSILAGAIQCKAADIVKALYEHGAKFETARVYLGDDKAGISRLELFQQTLTGRVAGGQLGPDADKVAQLERKIDDLTAAVQELTAELRGQKPAATQAKPPRQPYPSL